MKILLLGEYSNVHHTLALGLRSLGHDVTVASDGDGWKNYGRDIDLKRKSLGFYDTISYFLRLVRRFRLFRGYDIVQIINPVFLSLKAEKILPYYNYLRKHNKHVIMGAYGMDYYYAKACLDFKTFRYSDFNMGSVERFSAENDIFKRDWLFGAKGTLNRFVAEDCDAIIAGLYEYYVSYRAHFPNPQKLFHIPFPIIVPDQINFSFRQTGDPVRFFIGIQKSRSAYKGTDIMLRAVQRIVHDYPEAATLKIAYNVPFNEYKQMMNDSDVILDQLYSYTPAMNALEGMAHGLINVGGAEPEVYDFIGENELRPIINVQPNEQSVYDELQYLVIHRDELIPKLQHDTIEYLRRYHDYRKVALQYENIYKSLN